MFSFESKNQTQHEHQSQQVVTPRRYRVFTLREFILQHYTAEYLMSGPILDIAGGKGDLSWLFTNADRFDSIVIDPRVTDHTKLTRTNDWLFDHPIEATERSEPLSDQFQPLTRLNIQKPYLPAKHIRLFMDQECVDSILKRKENSNDRLWCEYFKRATERAEELEGKLGHHQPKKKKKKEGKENTTKRMKTEINPNKKYDNNLDNNNLGKEQEEEAEEEEEDDDDVNSGRRITSPDEVYHIFKSTQLFIGFHPDEATEAIIDLAISLEKPFIIVPCCVFPKLFINRRLNNKTVSSYYDFINYLKLKHPSIRIGQLPFHAKSGQGESGARSTVLYTLPGDYDFTCKPINEEDHTSGSGC